MRKIRIRATHYQIGECNETGECDQTGECNQVGELYISTILITLVRSSGRAATAR